MIVDVVPCGECKWFHIGGCMNEDVVGGFWHTRSKDDFCSKGIRKEEQDE